MKMLIILYKKCLCVTSICFLMTVTGCGTAWLDEQPLSAISTATFWKTESDARLALNGIYAQSNVGDNSYNNDLRIYTCKTGDGETKQSYVGFTYAGYVKPSDSPVATLWNRCYASIFRANYFLANIESVEMNASLKAMFIAEARFLRAYEYFYLTLMFGGVPLVTDVLTIDEANTQSRTPVTEVMNFAINEFSEAVKDLPATRPDNERGRILKSAALALKGRMLMIQKKWSEAAGAYQEIMNLNVHLIDPQYKRIFEEAGETSKEIILSTICITGLKPNPQNQLNYHPDMYGGYSELYANQTLVDEFLMIDGLPIEESPLYDPANPYDNRDPRLYASLFLPYYTVFRGRLFDNLSMASINVTGYGVKKYVTENYSGSYNNSGDDIILLRYAEVLLSYLEAKLENGDAITQELLDQTINKIRSREEVMMPSVTETNPAKLREILRRERRIEFNFERIIRYMDILRWGMFPEAANVKIYGIKLTDDPDHYTDLVVETEGKYRGHYICLDKRGSYTKEMALFPIPQFEIDINPNLQQNPGYE